MITTERFYFLNNPHTASRTCSSIFVKLGYYKNNKYGHHIPPKFIPTDKPKVTMIREPVDWVASWYADYYLTNQDFKEWLSTFKFPFAWKRDEILNIYESVADYYFLYEKGVESMFSELGYEITTPPVIGKNKYKPDLSEHKELIETVFAKDYEIYNKVLGGYKNWPKSGNVVSASLVGGGLAVNPELFIRSHFCEWKDRKTSCGRKTLDGADYKFCPYCGKEIKE